MKRQQPTSSDLLVISDELDSTRRDRLQVKDRTPRHFAELIKILLKRPHLSRTASYVVKNIGDSLMIRVAAVSCRHEVTALLKDILDAQSSLLETSVREQIKIRVLVSACEKHVPGRIIGRALRENLAYKLSHLVRKSKKLPLPRVINRPWFDGDMFGEDVSAIFRAADIAKGAQLVICEKVAQMLFAEEKKKYTTGRAIIDGLHISPELAFAPIKGLEDVYNVGKDYLRLREVTRANNNGDALSRRQQKAKVVTELTWGVASAGRVRGCKKELQGIIRGASFFRLFGLVQQSREDLYTKRSRTKRFCAKVGTAVGMVVLGAYPEMDTYWALREEITKRNGPGRIFGSISTKLVWEQSGNGHENAAAWDFGRPATFVFVKVKAITPSDDPSKDTVLPIIDGEPSVLNGYELAARGLLMGEWDNYAVYTAVEAPKHVDVDALAHKLRKVLKPCAERVSISVCIMPGK